MELNFLYCSHQNLKSSDDGSVGMLSVLDADWSVTKYGGVFDLMNIDELLISYSYCWPPAHLSRTGADQLLTSDINPSVVTRTYIYIGIFFTSEIGPQIYIYNTHLLHCVQASRIGTQIYIYIIDIFFTVYKQVELDPKYIY